MATLFATGTGADAVLTLAAPADASKRLVLGVLICSYTGNVTTGRLRIMSGATQVVDIDVGTEVSRVLPAGLPGEVGQPMEVRLYSGGANVVGKVNLIRSWQE